MSTVGVGYSLTVSNDPAYTPGSPNNARRYDKEHVLGEDKSLIVSRHSVEIETDAGQRSSAIVCANGGASAVHAHSALALDGRCLVAVCGWVVFSGQSHLILR